MIKRLLLTTLAALGLITGGNAMERKAQVSNPTNIPTKDRPEGDLAFRMVSSSLQNSSVPKAFIREAFTHDGIKKHSEISERFDRPYEKKSWEDYRKIFVKESHIKSGIEFHKENKELINNVAEEYRVDPFIVITIAGIESNYGVHHSQFSVFNSLYTQIHEMPKRSKWAANELAEFLKYCFINQQDPHRIGGSYAGAFGFGQFIPSSFNRYSVDFNEDGIKEPYGWPDVLGSIANYLIKNGYNANSRNYERDGDIWKSIYAYNHADNYVMAVLELSKKIRKRIEKRNN
ncbi:lytic murein transglycosylase [bacterium]|jgi:membrane-bound lytic murein transglycosylase B|nr:lytic murein transglycosylase [bacterium]MBT3903298.1 lytic murein transglycosylase [bacterium]MBT4577497.1 lytic murein transglycosylase [bacterium]MBT5345787.1 lytic murein transglycosylase [bacterium]MBT6130872.1 lytic murein transglycosylase [bacterium]